MPTLDAFPSPDDLAVVQRGIVDASERQGGPQAPWKLGIVLRDDGGAVVGGVIGQAFWGWLFVDILWVNDGHQGHGWGSRLLEAAEEKARERGMTGVWLDTFSFQARPFYEARGYRLFGKIDEHPPGHSRFFLHKRL